MTQNHRGKAGPVTPPPPSGRDCTWPSLCLLPPLACLLCGHLPHTPHASDCAARVSDAHLAGGQRLPGRPHRTVAAFAGHDARTRSSCGLVRSLPRRRRSTSSAGTCSISPAAARARGSRCPGSAPGAPVQVFVLVLSFVADADESARSHAFIGAQLRR